MKIYMTETQVELMKRIKAYHNVRISRFNEEQNSAFDDLINGRELGVGQCIILRNIFGEVIDFDACYDNIEAKEMTECMYTQMRKTVRDWIFDGE